MMSQTAYSTSPGKGDRGDLGGARVNDTDVITVNNPSQIAYGLRAQYPVGSDFKVEPYQGGPFAGIVIASKSNTTEGAYPAKSAIPSIRKGSVWVPVEQAVTPADAVYVRKSVEAEVFTVTLNVDFVAGNTVSGQVNGSAITPVAFNVDHNTTMIAFAAAIQALSNVATAVVTAPKVITVVGQNVGEQLTGITTSFSIAGGAGQAVITVANVTGPTGGAELGAFRKDANNVGNGATAVLLASAQFLTSASAGGTVLLDLNL
jgi:hypothetical protein